MSINAVPTFQAASGSGLQRTFCVWCRHDVLLMDDLRCPNCGRVLKEGPHVRAQNAATFAEGEETRMVSSITRLLAAGIISEADFPKKQKLPDLVALPFTRFGHLALFDQTLFHSIIWDTIAMLQARLKPWKRPHNLAVVGSVGAAAAIFLVGIAFVQSLWVAIIAAGGFLALTSSLISNHTKKYRDQLAGAKAELLTTLLSDQWKPQENSVLVQILAKGKNSFGDGALSRDRIPVLIVENEANPFPGYGRLQAEKTFVCRPKGDQVMAKGDINIMGGTVFANVRNSLTNASVAKLTSGRVIAVHGGSLLINSEWLDQEKAPLLWVTEEHWNRLSAAEPFASRAYYAIHAVFPEHNAAFTLFFRIFFAGNALSAHLALSTIGPPILDKPSIHKVLLRYTAERERRLDEGSRTAVSRAEADSDKKLITWIRSIGRATKDERAFVDPAIDLHALLELEPDQDELSPKEKADFSAEFHSVVKHSAMWPGTVGLKNANIRDTNSYAFVTDFFARPEMYSCVRTVYDQVSRTILDSFEDLGFDIADYKDKEGHYSINAEKIDNLILGETIHIKRPEEKKAAEEKKPAEESKAA